MSEDPRLAAARYRQGVEESGAGGGPTEKPEGGAAAVRAPSPRDTAAYVESAIQQAIRQGQFDDLPGAGKPIPHLGAGHDPDWWIRRKIETENLTGLGPAALTLRVEDAALASTLDALAREDDVRDAVEDFNRRVVEARRQLLGGPPVVTPTRDVEIELRSWRDRRAAAIDPLSAEPDAAPRRRWWSRRRPR